jgi:RHS repeat-associated protein
VGSYTYPTTGKVHAVSSVAGQSWTYDANGNLLTSGNRTLTWTSFNMPATAQVGASSYSWAYDADLRRVKFVSPAEITLYLAAGDKLLVEKVSAGGVTEERHQIYANGLPVAQHTTRTAGAAETRFLYRDQLGSTTLVASEAGGVTETLAYDAQGKRRFPNGKDDTAGTLTGTATDRGYTGHEHLDPLGLIHMNGRLYDPRVGRFVSADPIWADPKDPQSWNRYTYVLNNPNLYVDPTGYVTSLITDFNSQNGTGWGGYFDSIDYYGIRDSSRDVCDDTGCRIEVSAEIRQALSPRLDFAEARRPSGSLGVSGNGGASGAGRAGGPSSQSQTPRVRCSGPETQTTAGPGGLIGIGIPPTFVFPAFFVGGSVTGGVTSNGALIVQFQGVIAFGAGMFGGVGLQGGQSVSNSPTIGRVSTSTSMQIDANAGYGPSVGGSLQISGPGSSGWQMGVPIGRLGLGYGAQASVGVARTVTVVIAGGC